MQTMAERYALLKPHITVYGPNDNCVLPAIVLFHGCGGMRPHIHTYAKSAAETGIRAYVVDSFLPRGWDRAFAVSLICTGAFMQGYTALATLNEARILGIFARLIVRDHKPRYEAFMPRMWRHLGRNLEAPGMEGLKDWFLHYGFFDRLKTA